MATGTVVKEKSVLKLVHPGGFVELLKEPTTAAEVMKKNPRHCVTRPDVFKYPWIVVRPESVLKLGRVFFIVPNHTIYRLLQACVAKNQQSSLRRLKQTSPVDSLAKATPKYHDRDPHVKRQSQIRSRAKLNPKYRDHDRCLNQRYPSKSSAEVIPKQQDREGNLKKQSLVESWPKMIDVHQEDHQQFNQESPVSSLVKVRASSTRDYNFDDNHGGVAIPAKEDDGLKYKSSNPVMTLKSCLRKLGDNDRRSRGLRVIFILPSEDDEDSRRRIGESQ